ncbi:hypothetical protein OROMI_032585 [Orobanche minor]
MKFGKELASQMVQEWQGAYMDYNHLKILLKDLLTFKPLQPSPDPPSRPGSLKRRLTMYRAFSGLKARSSSLKKGNEDEVILVSAVPNEGSGDYYQTTFLRLSEEGGQQELLFFRKLDDEFNKVVKFYKARVEEAEMEADELSKQMDALIALRIKVDKPNYYVEQKDGGSQVKVGSDSNGNSGPATVIASVSGVKQGSNNRDRILSISGEDWRASQPSNKNTHTPTRVCVCWRVQIELDPPFPLQKWRGS